MPAMRPYRVSPLVVLMTSSALLLTACQGEPSATPASPSSAEVSSSSAPSSQAPASSSAPQPAQTTAPEASSTTLLTLESPAAGEITSRSPVNRNDGSRYAVIPVRLDPGVSTQITLTGPLQGKLALFDGNKLVASSYAACCNGNGPTSIVAQSKTGGEFELGVSGLDANSFGPFEVNATVSQARQGGELRLDETLTGWFNSSEAGTRHAGHEYQVNITEAGLYEFALRSNEFDAYLTLSGMGLNLEDDDGGGNNDARLIASLEPGQYQLKAAVYGGQGAGSYVISSGKPQAPEGLTLQQAGRVPLEGKIAGALSGDPLTYELEIPERRRVIIDMQSNDVDSYLRLYGNGVSFDDDDGGSGQDARFDLVLDPGIYQLEARALGANSGLFTLAIQTQEAPAAGGSTIQPGYAGEGYLTAGSPNHYQLTVEQAGSYVIYLGSTNFDALLTLQGNGINLIDDDGGNRFDSRLELPLEPGTYNIKVEAMGGGGGTYRLSVE